MTIPTAFQWPAASRDGGHARVRSFVKRMSGFDLFPSENVATKFAQLLNSGDPVAERYVDDTFLGSLGPQRSRDMLNLALATSIDGIPDAPASMRELFHDFEQVPEWVDPALVEQGAAVWRRWGYALGAIGNALGMDTYTEGSLAVPLSLTGGYAGQSALNRYLETSRWWIEICRPGAALTAGSRGRTISMQIRVMHVSVRRRVSDHPEWDSKRWGLPISQAEMMLPLLGGSVGSGLGLFLLGYVTTPREIRAAMHFNRYLGHLLGMQSEIFPITVTDGIRMLYLFDAARAYDSGAAGVELIESFAPAFGPRPEHRGLQRWRAQLHLYIQAGYAQLYVRHRYEMPSPWPGLALLFVRAPLITVLEVARRISPAVDRMWQRAAVRSWERWQKWASQRSPGQYDTVTQLRR